MDPTTPQGAYDVRRSRGAEERALERKQQQFTDDNPELVAALARIAALEAQLKPYTAGAGIRVDGHLISLSEGVNGAANGARGAAISSSIPILDLIEGGGFVRYTEVLYSGTRTAI